MVTFSADEEEEQEEKEEEEEVQTGGQASPV